MRKFILPLAVVALALGFAWVGGAAAQEDATTSAAGTIVGNSGGSHLVWTVPVEPNTDVTLSVTYVPCVPPNTVALSVYGSDGLTTHAVQDGHCKKTAAFNSASSDMLTVKLSYYEHGNALWWVFEADGVDLAQAQVVGGEAMVEEGEDMAEEAAEPAEEAEGEEMAEAEGEEMAEAEGEEMAEAEEMTPTEIGTVTVGMAEGTLLGTQGGAHAKYDVNLTGGQRYAGSMMYYMDAGGVWPAVGFAVWGPNGLEAISRSMHGMPAEVDFVASETGKYTVDVFNYHPGRTMMYVLTGMPVGEMEMTEAAEPAEEGM